YSPAPLLQAAGAQETKPFCCTDHVDPFIGTAGHGHTYPGATLPFGLVQLSPDTDIYGWDWCSGYHASDRTMLGFSHTHLSGTGCGDMGDILFAPTVGEVKLDPGSKDGSQAGYRSSFAAADEKAVPGYYSVILKPSGIKAELTATKRVGFHRYTFPATDNANIIIDLVHGIGVHGVEDKPIELELNIVSDHAVTGMRRSRGWARDERVYFAAEFSKPFVSAGTASGGGPLDKNSKQAKGENVKGSLTFKTSQNEQILAKVALSTVSIDGALSNLTAEAPDWDFDGTCSRARAVWERELSRVQVEGPDKNDIETFYTALYHAYLAPNLISDVNGQYRGSDKETHLASGFKCYSTFSLWDTFRAEHPLFTILNPKLVDDIIRSFEVQAQFHKDKTLPIWPLFANETYCMIGYHSFPVIAEAYRKGIRDWNAESLFDYMVQNSKRNDWWANTGYIPADKEEESVSKTLEFAYDDWTLAQFARALGKTAEYERFKKRSLAYRNLFDRETGFMRPRLQDGKFRTPFDPAAIPDKPRDYTEGNAWQYSWFVPHDVAGLISLMGGREAFVKKLDELFDHAPAAQETKDLDVTGLIGMYAQGNEPSHHVA
ncbi:MAG TPA: GH92 family glycosyl hydrolase, partial [Chroococcales cyanobacterium]